MRDILLSEFVALPGIGQTEAARLLGKTQGGIGYLIGEEMTGRVVTHIITDDENKVLRWYQIKQLPLPTHCEPAAGGLAA